MNAENPYSFTHNEIKAAFDAVEPESARALARNTWINAGTQWTAALDTFRSAIASAQNAAWQGVAAEKATSSITDYTRASADLNRAIDRVVSSINTAADAQGRTKSLIPDVVTLDGSSERAKEADDRERAAQDIMKANYIEPFSTEYFASAHLPRAESVIDYGRNLANEQSTTSSTTQFGENPSSTTSSTTSTSTDPNALTSNDRAVDTDNPSTTDPQTVANNNATTTTDPALNTSTNSNQDPTVTPTSYVPNSEDSTRPANVTSTGPTPISPNTNTNTNPGPNTLQPSPLGSQNVSNLNNAAGPQNSVAAQRAINGAPGGMMPHGAGRQGGEDKEHKTPSYLVNEENGNELIGPIPKTAPPVIGA